MTQTETEHYVLNNPAGAAAEIEHLRLDNERLAGGVTACHQEMYARDAVIRRLERKLAEFRRLYRGQIANDGSYPNHLFASDQLAWLFWGDLFDGLEEWVKQQRAASDKSSKTNCVVIGEGYCTTHKQDAFMCGDGKAFKWKEVAPSPPPYPPPRDVTGKTPPPPPPKAR